MPMPSVPAPNRSWPASPAAAKVLSGKGNTNLEDAVTSTGTSTPSEVASLAGGSTPRPLQHREEALRWGELEEDPTNEDDADECLSPTKRNRRRRRRGARHRTAELAPGLDTHKSRDADGVEEISSRTFEKSTPKKNLRDRAATTLVDLGLMVDGPTIAFDRHCPLPPLSDASDCYGDCGSPLSPVSPSRALMGPRCIVGTSPMNAGRFFQGSAHASSDAAARSPFYAGASPTAAKQLAPGSWGNAFDQQSNCAIPPLPGSGHSTNDASVQHNALDVPSPQCANPGPPPEALRSWLHAHLPEGADIQAQLAAVAPEVYED